MWVGKTLNINAERTARLSSHDFQSTRGAIDCGLRSVGSNQVKLKHVYLTAPEPEALARFYEALGLTIRFADRGKWIQFAGDETAFCVASPAESATEHSRNAVAVFEVEDLGVALDRARAEGAELLGEVRNMGPH
jgi:predicted enzyme related to lactoylglutathione lyase